MMEDETLAGQKKARADAWIDPVKWADLVESLPDSLEEVVVTYLEDLPVQIQEIVTAYKRQDLETVGRVAHALKSSSGIFGIHKMIAACRAVEVGARSHEIGLGDKIRALQDVAPPVEAALREQLSEWSARPEEEE